MLQGIRGLRLESLDKRR
ncbi:hypothetical protein RDI58_017329 [Solanum bulbocastanum]|uniref:Uncharacterized protein n=1 Tax=Solanum bulbocastanum TaxID=147425 RepID=A0AAN8T9B7_SOLBU